MVADLLSYILHPAMVMLAAAAVLSGLFRPDVWRVMLDAAVLAVGLLPGLGYIFVQTRKGCFSHFHLLDKKERRFALPLLLAGLVFSFVLYELIGMPAVLRQSLLLGIGVGAGAVIISRFWKISLHAAVAMGCAALFTPISAGLMLCFAGSGLLVGISRLISGHHSPAQVVAGWLYGFGMTSLLRMTVF